MSEQNAPLMPNTSRRRFLGQTVAGLATAGAVVGATTLSTGEAQAQGGGNVLPNLYPGLNSRQFKAIQDHENEHVATIVSVLGSAARPKPNFKNLVMPDIRAFATIAQAFENVGVGAYLAATPVVFNKQYLAAAASIALIEARHAGYLNVVLNSLATDNVAKFPQDFETPLTIAQVQGFVAPYVTDLAGGPALTFNATPSKNNDVAIFNFALALEYLEAEFYNINVPRFFPA